MTDKDDSSLTSTSTVQVREVPGGGGMELSVPECRLSQSAGLPARLALQGSAVTWEHGPHHSWDSSIAVTMHQSIDFQVLEQAGTVAR